VPAPVTSGSLLTQINTERAAEEALQQQVIVYERDIATAGDAVARTKRTVDAANRQLSVVQEQLDQAAAAAYKKATELGPLGGYTNDLRNLSILAPGMTKLPGGEALGRELEKTRQTVQTAQAAHDAAVADLQGSTAQRAGAIAERDRRHQRRLSLEQRNAGELARQFAAQEAADQRVSEALGVGGAVDGMRANPKAIAALNWAIKQTGKPYEWGAVGPDSFDCSGLVLQAYRSVGVGLPRIANDQYRALTPLPYTKLLPGDLLFFGTDRSDWRSIHHVAIYLGGGRMLHAPTTGDVVKVSPIWWAEYFGAARVLPALPAEQPKPTPIPIPSSTSPRPGGSATPSPSPGGSSSPTPSPSASGSPSGSPSPARSTSGAASRPATSSPPPLSPTPGATISTTP
jgi:cell wall-associated NlpC family hydrolase